MLPPPIRGLGCTMSDRDGARRLVVNAVVLVVLALALGAVTDYAAIWMGFSPPVGCALLPYVQALSMAGATVMAIIGLAILLLVRNTVAGVTLLFGALVLMVLPEVTSIYLGQVLGVGCPRP